MRRIILNIHLTLALVSGLFLLFFGITGSIMAFEPELDHMLHAHVSYVVPSGEPKSLAELGTAAAKAIPGQRVTGFLLSVSPDLSWQVLLGRRGVFVNQYTGEILGERNPNPDFLSRIHQLHLRLLIQNRSDSGKTIMTWAGASLLLLIVTGLYLWWPVKRVAIDVAAAGRRFWFDVHNAVGVFSLVFLLAIAITGIVIGFDDRIQPLIYAATHSRPGMMYAPPRTFDVTPSGSPIGPDQALAVARASLPDATPISINVPAPTGTYNVSARYPEDRTPGGRSRIVIDQYGGGVLAVEGSREAPSGTRLITLNRAIHTGDVFGMPSKIVMSLASLAVVAQLVTGIVMWLKKQ